MDLADAVLKQQIMATVWQLICSGVLFMAVTKPWRAAPALLSVRCLLQAATYTPRLCQSFRTVHPVTPLYKNVLFRK